MWIVSPCVHRMLEGSPIKQCEPETGAEKRWGRQGGKKHCGFNADRSFVIFPQACLKYFRIVLRVHPGDESKVFTSMGGKGCCRIATFA